MIRPKQKKFDAPELIVLSMLALFLVLTYIGIYYVEAEATPETPLPAAEIAQREIALEPKEPPELIIEQPEETEESTELTTEAATETEPETTEPPAPELDPWEVELIARTIWGEADGVKSKAEQAAVAWCILNRVDAWGQSIEYVVTKPYQFLGYRPTGDCPERHYELAADVLTRWYAEKAGETNVGRTLPSDYLYFIGDLKAHNWFSIEWQSGIYWDWSLPSPYDT